MAKVEIEVTDNDTPVVIDGDRVRLVGEVFKYMRDKHSSSEEGAALLTQAYFMVGNSGEADMSYGGPVEAA